MKKTAYALLYLAVIGFIATIIVNFCRRQDVGAGIFLFSCFFLLTGLIVALFSSKRYANPNKSALQSRLNIILNTLSFEGVIMLFAGAWFYSNHWGGGLLLLDIGIFMILMFLIVLPYKIITRKK